MSQIYRFEDEQADYLILDELEDGGVSFCASWGCEGTQIDLPRKEAMELSRALAKSLEETELS